MTHHLATILPGDCRETPKTLPAQSVHCVMTSPPYFALRSYLPVGDADKARELGTEPTPDEFIASLIGVFREVRRVLRDDGCCWVNLGDTYAGGGRGGNPVDSVYQKQATNTGSLIQPIGNLVDIKPGNLLNVPHRFAAAMQADGWVWRQTVIWHKQSPMPESLDGTRWVRCRVKVNGTGWTKATHTSSSPDAFGRTDTFGSGGDNKPNPHAAKWSECPGCIKCEANGGYVLRTASWRCTTAHEYLFMFTKGMNYFSSADQVAERATYSGHQSSEVRGAFDAKGIPLPGGEPFRAITETRNPRSVWTLSHEPTKVKHFASYPSKLCRIPILSSTSNVGCCAACGAQYATVVESERVATRLGLTNKIWKHDDSGDASQRRSDASPNLDPQRHIVRKRVIGHRPTCRCNAVQPVPATVLDPFMGTGTTGQVAVHLGRRFIGCELSEEYIAFAEEKIDRPPKWLRTRESKKSPSALPGQLSLFSEIPA